MRRSASLGSGTLTRMVEFTRHASFLELALVASGALVLLNVFWSAVAIAAERYFGRSYRIWQLEGPPGQIRRELGANLRFDVVVGCFVAGLIHWQLVVLGDSQGQAGAGLLTFAVSWLAFEIYYWAMHRAFHTPALYRFHRFHHESHVTTAFTGTSTSTVEALGWAIGFGLGPVLLSLFVPISPIGWGLYFLYNYSGNIVGHINAEPFPKLMSQRSQSWISHPVVYHSLHHARFLNHYGFGSTFMDRLLGTEWKDWAALHVRVRDGQPMKKLAERGA
jgi:sterol desaturase/sphingolipid hydroxylase (fatty acid hydroxylase superfamily)